MKWLVILVLIFKSSLNLISNYSKPFTLIVILVFHSHWAVIWKGKHRKFYLGRSGTPWKWWTKVLRLVPNCVLKKTRTRVDYFIHMLNTFSSLNTSWRGNAPAPACVTWYSLLTQFFLSFIVILNYTRTTSRLWINYVLMACSLW